MEATKEEVLLTAELHAGLNIQISHRKELHTRSTRTWRPKTVILNRYYVKWQPMDSPDWTVVGDYSTLNKAFRHFHQMQRAAAKEKLKFVYNDNRQNSQGLHSPQRGEHQGLLW
jgi:hypothetical protein